MFAVLAIRRNLQCHRTIEGISKKVIQRTYINVPRDIVLYENKKSIVMPKIVVLAGLGQWLITGYMSFVMSQHMPAFFSWIPIAESVQKEKPNNRIPLADWKYRFGFSGFAFSVATAIFFTTIIFSLRSVTAITLLKGTDKVMFTSHTPIGTSYNVTSSIMHVSAIQPRSAKNTLEMPLKLRDHRFHFIVDKEKGYFPQPSLFDRTVGVNRNFGKEEK